MDNYLIDISKAFSNGKKEGMDWQKGILNKKIDYKIETIEILKEDFRTYMVASKNKQEEKYWCEEIVKLIEFQRLLRELKE